MSYLYNNIALVAYFPKGSPSVSGDLKKGKPCKGLEAVMLGNADLID